MNDKLIFINPDGKFKTSLQNETYKLQRILKNPDAISIYLISINKEFIIEVVFDAYVEYFCHRIKRGDTITSNKKKLFSLVENSDVFNWLEKESCGIFSFQSDNNAKHFQINTENDVIDIVTYNLIRLNVL
jgi:hypothetical protein